MPTVLGSMFNALHAMFETQYPEAVCRTARKVLDIADDADDAPTEDLLTQRLQTHEKHAWMLRSLLQ